MATLQQIQEELNPETVIIESTGVGIPENIRNLIREHMDVPVFVVVLVDGSRWFRILPAAGELARAQLKGNDLLLINKADLFTEQQIQSAMEQMKQECPQGEIIACSSVSDHLENTVLKRILQLLHH